MKYMMLALMAMVGPFSYAALDAFDTQTNVVPMPRERITYAADIVLDKAHFGDAQLLRLNVARWLNHESWNYGTEYSLVDTPTDAGLSLHFVVTGHAHLVRHFFNYVIAQIQLSAQADLTDAGAPAYEALVSRFKAQSEKINDDIGARARRAVYLRRSVTETSPCAHYIVESAE